MLLHLLKWQIMLALQEDIHLGKFLIKLKITLVLFQKIGFILLYTIFWKL